MNRGRRSGQSDWPLTRITVITVVASNLDVQISGYYRTGDLERIRQVLTAVVVDRREHYVQPPATPALH